MSIAGNALGELPIGADLAPTTASKGKPPPKRQMTARADFVQWPEAR
jgi:hypothetical protein